MVNNINPTEFTVIYFGIKLKNQFKKSNTFIGKSRNRGNACGRTPYRETNLDTSYMRITNEASERKMNQNSPSGCLSK